MVKKSSAQNHESINDLKIEEQKKKSKDWKTYIIIFQVSTGKSASLKDQSNFSFATGSSVGSWYGARYSWARPFAALMRCFGSNTSIFSSRSTAINKLSASLQSQSEPREQ